MNIDITVTATNDIIGVDWKAYSRHTNKDTTVFFEYWREIRRNTGLDFETIVKHLNNPQSFVKSKAGYDKHFNNGLWEVSKPNKVLPLIWIIKNDEDLENV